ncbi:Aste57867_21736 [Aphanomyces stellatus]|uniref:Aste57867_21736 protein n=1 Tax=Aphanomyces stellatus TaxID=120398 RepID=A0A485LN55_9STRA|nr:hypothetical protein As57867_021667 [Aphanomyces stellatus]VFT98405.1 Aste57867_21736 [Aphanomyces stellatus]
MVATCISILGGILCAAAYGGKAINTLWFLIIARGVLGFGIGGEYPLAASSSSENATSARPQPPRRADVFVARGRVHVRVDVGFDSRECLGREQAQFGSDVVCALWLWRAALFLVYFRITA